eukprot:g286.t1
MGPVKGSFSGDLAIKDKQEPGSFVLEVNFKNGDTMKEPPHPLLVADRVKHVGDAVAMVIAETRDQARDAAELIEVDYEELDAVTDPSAAAADGIPEHKVRVVAPDVGGGFGSKIFHYTEEALVTWASREIKRPIKWTSDRSEAFMTDAHGRDHVTKAEMGFDADGNIVALQATTFANLGAYLSTFAPAVPTYLHGTLMQGLYTTPKVNVDVTGMFTHTNAVDAYRGAGRPEATYLLERMLDLAALEMGKDPAKLRLQNFIPPFDGVEEPGYQTQVALQYDSGDYHAVLERALEMVVADRLGIPMEDVDLVHGDSDAVAFGMGTYGSRSLAVGGSAIVKSLDKVLEKGARIAAHKLEAAVEDLEYAEGKWTVKGTDKSIGFGDIALTAYVPHDYPAGEEPGLDFSSFYDPANFTYPFGAHIAIVEVDAETGRTKLKRFIAVDDVGNVINPMIVDGQIHGGLAQGIGQALLEGALYDDNGQLINGSYMDYAMPRADDLPSFEIDRTTTPCPHNPLGVKGAGEAGCIGSTPAVVNAVIDALWKGGHEVKDLLMPLTPERVWKAMQ